MYVLNTIKLLSLIKNTQNTPPYFRRKLYMEYFLTLIKYFGHFLCMLVSHLSSR